MDDDQTQQDWKRWVPYDLIALAAEFNCQPTPGEASGRPQTRYFSVRDGVRLMISNGVDHRMVNPKGPIKDAQSHAARYFANGEIGTEEIDKAEAEALSLKIRGVPLAELGVPIIDP